MKIAIFVHMLFCTVVTLLVQGWIYQHVAEVQSWAPTIAHFSDVAAVGVLIIYAVLMTISVKSL